MRRLENKCITIGLMTYNQQNYIEDTLQSIIDQNYNNIELLILDDHSSDSTKRIINGMERILRKRFVNYQFLFHEANSGNISRNCNELICHSHGDYFKILGGDDLLLPDYCRVMSDVFRSCPEVGYVFSDMYRVDGNYRYGQELGRADRFVAGTVPDTPEKLFNRLLYGNFLPAPSAIYKTEMLKKIRGFDEAFTIEDYPMWLKLSRAGIQYRYIDKPYVFYRVNDRSLSLFSGEERTRRRRRFENIADNEIRMIDKYCADIEQNTYIKSMAITIENLALLCCRLQIHEEGEFLDAEAEKRGLMLSSRNYIRDDSQISVLKEWQNPDALNRFRKFLKKNKIEKVAVYGYGARGKRLIRFLEKAGIAVAYLVDRAGQKLSEQYRVYKPEEIFPESDAAIISLYHSLNDEQMDGLIDHGCRRVIEIEDILFNGDVWIEA